MACKKVEKYNDKGELCKIFDSLSQCQEEENLSAYVIKSHCDINHLKNGFYYKIINKPYMVKAVCDWCGKEFDCQRFRTEDGRRHLFCSRECMGSFFKSQTELNCICEYCGKPYHAKQYQIDKYGSKYCSRECQNKAKETLMMGERNHQYGLKGNKNASWKSDERISYYGYKLIRKLEHPFKNSDDFVFEHRLVAEQHLLNDENSVVIDGKKYLAPTFVVHHIDFNRLNNSPDNLIVLTEPEHAKMHMTLKTDIGMKEYCDKYGLDVDVIKHRSSNSNKYKKQTKESV